MWPSFRQRSSQRQDMSRVSIFWNKIVFAFFTFSAFKTFPCCCLNVFVAFRLVFGNSDTQTLLSSESRGSCDIDELKCRPTCPCTTQTFLRWQTERGRHVCFRSFLSLSEFQLNFLIKWLQIQSWPPSCHSPLWSTLTLGSDTQTCWQKHHLRMKMTQKHHFEWKWHEPTIVFDGNAGWSSGNILRGFLVLGPSAVWVKCKRRQTPTLQVFLVIWLID